MFKLPYEPVKHEYLNHVVISYMNNFKAIETKLNELENKREEPKMDEKTCCNSVIPKETLRHKMDEITEVLTEINVLADMIVSKTLIPRPCGTGEAAPVLQNEPSIEDFINMFQHKTKIIYDTLSNINDQL